MSSKKPPSSSLVNDTLFAAGAVLGALALSSDALLHFGLTFPIDHGQHSVLAMLFFVLLFIAGAVLQVRAVYHRDPDAGSELASMLTAIVSMSALRVAAEVVAGPLTGWIVTAAWIGAIAAALWIGGKVKAELLRRAKPRSGKAPPPSAADAGTWRLDDLDQDRRELLTPFRVLGAHDDRPRPQTVHLMEKPKRLGGTVFAERWEIGADDTARMICRNEYMLHHEDIPRMAARIKASSRAFVLLADHEVMERAEFIA